MCCGYSKEPSQWDSSFEHPKHMFKLTDKKIIAIYAENICLTGPMGSFDIFQGTGEKLGGGDKGAKYDSIWVT